MLRNGSKGRKSVPLPQPEPLFRPAKSPRKGPLPCTVRVCACTLWLDKEVRMEESGAQKESTRRLLEIPRGQSMKP